MNTINKPIQLILGFFLLFFHVLLALSAVIKSNEEPGNKDLVHKIQNVDELNQILASSGDKLLMLDLYADWCMPCRALAPTLEEIARENPDMVKVYKINIDENPEIAALRS